MSLACQLGMESDRALCENVDPEAKQMGLSSGETGNRNCGKGCFGGSFGAGVKNANVKEQ